MVCVRVTFHENDGNHENDENDNDNSDSYKQGVECWIHGNHGNHDNYENHGNPGCKPRVPQTTGLEIPDIGSRTADKRCFGHNLHFIADTDTDKPHFLFRIVWAMNLEK